MKTFSHTNHTNESGIYVGQQFVYISDVEGSPYDGKIGVVTSVKGVIVEYRYIGDGGYFSRPLSKFLGDFKRGMRKLL